MLTRLGFPGGASGKEPACQLRRLKGSGFKPWVRKRGRHGNTPIFLPGESHGLGPGPWGGKESDTIETLSHGHDLDVLRENGQHLEQRRWSVGSMPGGHRCSRTRKECF